jgi:hypothetical protein
MNDRGTGGLSRIPTIEEDFEALSPLRLYNPNSVIVIELEEDQYTEDFEVCNSIRLNIELFTSLGEDEKHKAIEFSYPDPNEQEPQEPVYQKPLSERIVELENENLELKLALAEAVEANEQDKTEIQLAIAELAELVVGGGQVG